MRINISANLTRLAEYLGGDLYLVGGYVRNTVLKLPVTDIDVCGGKTPSEVISALNGTEFHVISDYANFGSLLILSGDEKYEYTTFREDSYVNGSHRPDKVAFTKSLETDAKRRDFTVNAIYYNILERRLIDPLNGLWDIKTKVLRACAGERTFLEDGLRLLRLVRQTGEFGFNIEWNTMNYAVKNADKLKDITAERKRGELDKILLSDVKYGEANSNKIHDVLVLMKTLNLWEYVIPELTLGYGLEQNPTYHAYNVFEHSIYACAYIKPPLRMAGLLHDIGKPKSFFDTGYYHSHDTVGYELTKKVLGQQGLKYPSKFVERTARLVREHMKDLLGDMKERKLRLYFLENYDIIDDLISVKIADGLACGKGDLLSFTVMKWIKLLKEMREEKLPFNLSELNIDGLDVIKEIGEENAKYVAKILKKLQAAVIVKDKNNTYSDLNHGISRAFSEVKAEEKND